MELYMLYFIPQFNSESNKVKRSQRDGVPGQILHQKIDRICGGDSPCIKCHSSVLSAARLCHTFSVTTFGLVRLILCRYQL